MSLALGITLFAAMGGVFVAYIVGAMMTLDKFEKMITSNMASGAD